MNKKLESSLRKIDKLFDKMFYNRIETKKGKVLSATSLKNYKDQVKSILRAANKEFGIEKIEDLDTEMFEKLIDKRIENYNKNNKSSEASNINSKVSAMRAFYIGFKETNIYRKTKKESGILKFDESYIKDLRDKIHCEGVYRNGQKSPILRATKEQVMTVVENVQSDGYNTVNRKKTADIALLSFATGARVSSCLKMKVEDIDFEDKTISMVKAKGGLTYYVDLRDEDIPLLKSFVEDLKPNQRIFEFFNKDGKKMSVEESRKVIQRYISNSAKEFSKDGKEFTFHAIRKAFALETMKSYIDKIHTAADVEAEVVRLAKRDPKISDKYDRLFKRYNAYRIKQGMPMKELSKKEAVTFFTSIQLGHFRNDIVSNYYCTYQEAYKNKR